MSFCKKNLIYMTLIYIYIYMYTHRHTYIIAIKH